MRYCLSLVKMGWNKLLVCYQFPLTTLFLFLFGLISKLAHAWCVNEIFTLVDIHLKNKNEASAVLVRILTPVFCPAAKKHCAANLGRANRCKYANPWAGARDQGNCWRRERVASEKHNEIQIAPAQRGNRQVSRPIMPASTSETMVRARERERVCCPSQIWSAASVSRRECSPTHSHRHKWKFYYRPTEGMAAQGIIFHLSRRARANLNQT